MSLAERKTVGWHLSLNATVTSMKKAWDKALSNEGLIVIIGAPRLPTALSDHGVQMAKKTARQFFKDLGIKQLFARYQTPKHNTWIESWFRILKYDWLRFKDEVVDDRNIALKYRKEAYNFTEDIDPTDAIFVALALFLNAKLWSGDKRLKEGLENKGRHMVLTTKNLSTNYGL